MGPAEPADTKMRLGVLVVRVMCLDLKVPADFARLTH